MFFVSFFTPNEVYEEDLGGLYCLLMLKVIEIEG